MPWTKGQTARADGSPRGTKPGSVAHGIATVVAAKSRETGRGLTVAEIADAYTATFGMPLPTALTSRVHSLVKGGVLVAIGGRAGRTRYAHRDHVAACSRAEAPADGDDVLTVLEACVRAADRHGRPVSTQEVTAEIERQGWALRSTDINAVRRALATLARPRTRGAAEWHEPRVVRETRKGMTGHGSAWWWPTRLGRPDGASSAPGDAVSRSEAMRRSVAACVLEMGRPVSRRELRWWIQAGGTPTAAMPTLAKDLDATAQADRRAMADGMPTTGRLLKIAGDLTAFGAAPARFAVGPVSPMLPLVGRLEDAVLGLRLADEVEGIARLQRQSTRRGSGILSHLADVREARLASAFLQLTAGASVPVILAAANALLLSYTRLEGLVPKMPHSSDSRDTILRELRERQRHVAAVADVLAILGFGQRLTRFRRPWRLTAIKPPVVFPFLAGAIHELDQPITWPKLLKGVRRTVAEAPTKAAIPGEGEGPPPVFLDRVDALLAIYRRVPVARANALLGAADGLLGTVLRDPALLRDVAKEAADAGDGSTRRAAVIALGLLGALEDDADALAVTGEVLDVSAAILALVLHDPASAPQRIARIVRTASNAEAARLAEKAVLRVQRGRLISVIG